MHIIHYIVGLAFYIGTGLAAVAESEFIGGAGEHSVQNNSCQFVFKSSLSPALHCHHFSQSSFRRHDPLFPFPACLVVPASSSSRLNDTAQHSPRNPAADRHTDVACNRHPHVLLG